MFVRLAVLTAALLGSGCAGPRAAAPAPAVMGRVDPAADPAADRIVLGEGARAAGAASDRRVSDEGARAATDASATRSTAAAGVPVTLPPLRLQTLDGQDTELQAALGGKVALVAVWATWCKTCKGELAALTRLAERAPGATVIGVAVGEARDTVAAFVARRGLRYRQLVDEEFRLPRAIGSDRIPTTLVVDRDGRIIHLGGALDETALAAFRSELEKASAVK